MINELNTIVQFFAAIYLTITIDSIMFKRFWTPDLYKIIEKKLNECNFALSTPLKTQLLDSIKSSSTIVDSRARKRGGYMLSIAILILIFAGYEKVDISDVIYFVYSITIIAAFIGLFIGISTWKTWHWVVFSIGGIIIFYFVSLYIFTRTSLSTNCTTYCQNHNELTKALPKILTLVFLIVPIIGRLFINWLYSTVYISCLSKELLDERAKFNQTKEGIETRDRNKCDQSYHSAFKDAYFDESEDQDQINTQLANTLKEHLVSICVFKKWYILVKYACSKDYKTKSKNLLEENPNQTYTLPASKIDTTSFQSYVKEYDNHKPSIKIVDFCREKGIDPVAFKKYRSDNKRTK